MNAKTILAWVLGILQALFIAGVVAAAQLFWEMNTRITRVETSSSAHHNRLNRLSVKKNLPPLDDVEASQNH